MKKQALLAGAIGLCLMSATVAQASVTVTKAPDLGSYWHPLSGDGNQTYIYADSFVAPVSGTVSNIGIWLANNSGDTSAQPVTFEVLGSSGGAPDASNILATTGVLTLDVGGSLSLYSANTTSSFNLVAGQTYWVAGDERGQSSGGEMYVGGHTQNSGNIFDNGTFWYSNDPGGASFAGQNLTPEMAFTVTENGVPEPATWALMLVGVGGVGAAMRTVARKAATAQTGNRPTLQTERPPPGGLSLFGPRLRPARRWTGRRRSLKAARLSAI